VDASAAQRIVEALDQELARRQTKKDEAEDERWQQEFQGDELIELMIFVKQLERQWDRTKPGATQVPLDEVEFEKLEDTAITLYSMADILDGLEQAAADEAAGIRRRPKVTMHVKSAAKLLPAAPKLDPAAPKPAERAGRRGQPGLGLPGTPEADGVWKRGQVLTIRGIGRAWFGLAMVGNIGWRTE
jgi:hypothetical protein